MAIYKTARFRVKPGSLARCRAAIEEFVAYIREHEPGTRLYLALQEKRDPESFLHLMIFADAGAEESHRTSPGVQKFVAILYPETVAGVDFTDFTEVAASRS